MNSIIICNDKRKPVDYIRKKLYEAGLEENIDFTVSSMEESNLQADALILKLNNFNEAKEPIYKKNEIIIRGEYNNNNIKIRLTDITYIQKERYGCIVHVTKEKSENDYDGQLFLRKKLDIIYKRLKDYEFEYAHSSYLVNICHVDECGRTKLKLDSGVILDISRSKSKLFNEKFINYIDKFLLQ